MLGTALYEAGHAAAAEHQFRAVLERQPSSEPVRVALAEALLSQARWTDAAAVAAEVADDAPCAPAARRSELFALVVGRERERVPGALDRARRAGVSGAEVELFAAWNDALAGLPLPEQLPEDAAGLLVVTLEALLRVQEIDAFVALLPALERVGLPWRERREQLASMYMRRGYLESAADEWIAVCEEAGPDVPALIGLAQVAVARELPDDAVVFAREVHALEPGHAGASRILAHFGAEVGA
jgi:tetratricopeptide (TPR) repeat protein